MQFEHWDKVPGHKKAGDERKEGAGDHSENLFGMDEDTGGERRNLATGKPINNSTSRMPENMKVQRNKGTEKKRDVLGPVIERDKSAQAAEEWLEANDPERNQKGDMEKAA